MEITLTFFRFPLVIRKLCSDLPTLQIVPAILENHFPEFKLLHISLSSFPLWYVMTYLYPRKPVKRPKIRNRQVNPGKLASFKVTDYIMANYLAFIIIFTYSAPLIKNPARQILRCLAQQYNSPNHI